MQNKLTGLLLTSLALSALGGVLFLPASASYQFHQIDRRQMLADSIVHYYKTQGINVDPETVKEVVYSAYADVPQYFPKQQFSPKDALAVAMVETDFNQKMVGKYGEVGVFQILNPDTQAFSVRGNLIDFLRELQQKYQQRRDYKTAIISYNGFTLRANPPYWRKFVKARQKIEKLSNEVTAPDEPVDTTDLALKARILKQWRMAKN